MTHAYRSILILAGLLTMTAAAQDSREEPRANGLPEAQYTAEGSERCLRCHAGERMALMADTAHGDETNPHTPYAERGCESCHGPGSLHASRARGGRGVPSLVTFGRDESTEVQTQACIRCHADSMGDLAGMEWDGSAHDAFNITCTTCHQAHIVGNPMTDADRQRERCTICHSRQIAEHPRFEDKGIAFEALTCYDCHDVHQLIRKP